MDGRLLNEMKIDGYNEKRIQKMPAFINGWYLNMKASKKTAATCREYLRKAEKFLKYINPDVSVVTPNDITSSVVTQYYINCQTKKNKDGTVSYTSDSYQLSTWYSLDSLLTYMQKNGLIKDNYIHMIEKPKNKDLDRINANRVLLTKGEFHDILLEVKEEYDDFFRIRNMAIMLMFMNTGMRETALLSLMMSDVDLHKRKINIVDKGNKRHEYVINDSLEKALKDWLKERKEYTDQHFFVSSKDKGMNVTDVYDMVRKYTKAALGTPMSPHKLRAGFCSILYANTHDIEFVRRAVGHTNAATTQRYIVTKGEEKKKAAEIMDSLL